MKNYFLKLTTLLCISLSLFSCDQEDDANANQDNNQSEETVDCNFELAFEMAELQDGRIKLTATKGVEDVGYAWKVNGDFINASGKEVTIDSIKEKSEICLFQETPDCPNGKSTCKSYVPNGENGEGNKCSDVIKLNIDFIAGLDINVKNVYFSDIANNDYQWTVNGENVSAVLREGLNGAPIGSLYWGPGVGETEFCFTLFTEDCPSGISKCVTYVLTEELVDVANTSVNGELPVLVMKKLENGKFTLGTK